MRLLEQVRKIERIRYYHYQFLILHFQIFDGETLVGHFCGQYSLKTFTSMSDELFIRFSINYPEESEYGHTFSGGFLARYKQVERKYNRYFRPQN